MSQTLSLLPLSFWVVIALLIGGAVWAVWHFRDGSGLPMLLVLGTVAAWYVGDVLYNDYPNYHVELFEQDVLRGAWWQVTWFVIVFLVATPWMHRWLNARYLGKSSGVLLLFKYGVRQPVFQKQLNLLFVGCASIWLFLILIAAFRTQGRILYFLFPFLGEGPDPWGRGRIGSGFDAIWTAAFYFQLLVTGIFGVVAALATNRRIRMWALIFCLFAMPYFILQRARNIMLAAVIPGVLSWIFLRLRGRMWKRFVVLIVCFLLVNAWMGFVIANRSEMSITEAIKQKGLALSADEGVHHEGLNMYEELCWINTFIEDGSYKPNWGSRYFAELVNPIPRALWPGKPLIGIDYAIARGQAGGGAEGAGVYATISTGMIGQGVVNFGRILGPAFAALLMSLWVTILARLDLRISELGRLPLYFCGLILTFNLGRDITLITLYPFVFGYLALWMADQWGSRQMRVATRTQVRQKPRAGFNQRRTFPQPLQRPNATSTLIVKATAKKIPPSNVRAPSRNHF